MIIILYLKYRIKMKKFKISGLGIFLFVLIGCATAPENSEKVTVINGNNSFTSSCKMLGTVTSVVNPWAFGSESEASKQALWNMQADAYDTYGADTLSIQRFGTSLTEIGGQGIALKCY